MRKIKQVKKIYFAKEIIEVKCNKCAELIYNESFENWLPAIEVDHRFIYDSDLDGQQHNFDLCINCYKKIIKRFKIPVTIKDEDYLE